MVMPGSRQAFRALNLHNERLCYFLCFFGIGMSFFGIGMSFMGMSFLDFFGIALTYYVSQLVAKID